MAHDDPRIQMWRDVLRSETGTRTGNGGVMWFALWVGFVIVLVVGSLLYARWRERTTIDGIEALPEPRGRQRPAPDVVEARDIAAARLRLLAGATSLVAPVWLVVRTRPLVTRCVVTGHGVRPRQGAWWSARDGCQVRRTPVHPAPDVGKDHG